MTTRRITKTAITAAAYAAITLAISPISYGIVQLRISEVIVLLAYIDPFYVPGLALGCAIANIWSPLGIIDIFIGTLNTLITAYAISKTKNLILASFWPTIFSFIIGIELWTVFKIPFFLATLSISISEFMVVTLIGYPLFKLILKNDKLISLLKD